MKRVMDVALCAVLLGALGIVALMLLLLNPWFNHGPLLYVQNRVGRYDHPFVMYKFRTMSIGSGQARFADTETYRISKFAQLLRRFRIDELPQFVNVLKGEMSLIGPRPEQPEFARDYAKALPCYIHRHAVRPGISGLAQVVQGYTSDTSGTQRKLEIDLRYIAQSGFRMETYVMWRTIVVILNGFGAR